MAVPICNQVNGGNQEVSVTSLKSGPVIWIQQQIEDGVNPRDVLQHLMPDVHLPDCVDEIALWKIVWEIITEPLPRKRLVHINSLQHFRNLLIKSRSILVLTGAGVSVSCGIPDFRSRDGVYARLSRDYPDLPDPQAMFDISYFRTNPRPFFKFAKEIFPGQYRPSLGHRFIARLDRLGVLLRNYTQNIDTLEQVAGIANAVQCHGSFSTATCMNCKRQVDGEELRKDIFDEKIPYCTACMPGRQDELNIMKPDIVFFGESLPTSFYRQIDEDKGKVDLLIVIGSSLKVRPVSFIPSLVPADVPQVLINREPLSHMRFDIELLGNSDDILCELCHQLGGHWLEVIENYRGRPIMGNALRLLHDVGDAFCDYSRVSDSASHAAIGEPARIRRSHGAIADADVESCDETRKDCDESVDAYKGPCLNDVHVARDCSVHSSHKSDARVTCIETERNSCDCGVPVRGSSVALGGSKQVCGSPSGAFKDVARAKRLRTGADNFSGSSADSDHSCPREAALSTRKWKRVASGAEPDQSLSALSSSSSSSGAASAERWPYYLRIPPNRYIFHGAELPFEISDSDTISDFSSDDGENTLARTSGATPCDVSSYGDVEETSGQGDSSNRETGCLM